MKAILIDADEDLVNAYEQMHRPNDPPLTLNREPVAKDELHRLVAGYDVCLNDHTFMPEEMLKECETLKEIIFLGTGASSYIDTAAAGKLGVRIHTIKGYGNLAVAEHTIALMWAAARGVARMDREQRHGNWMRAVGTQLSGKTLGLIGFGGIAVEVARIAGGCGMKVLAWNRTPKTAQGVAFVPLEVLLKESHVVSIHLHLTPETKGLLSADRIAAMRRNAILVNTARGAIVDEAAMIAALKRGHLAHAALDVFVEEPLPVEHELNRLDNVTISAHSAFLTPEAAQNLVRSALDIMCSLARSGI